MSKKEEKKKRKMKRKSNEPIVIRLNLSATMITVILVIVAITTITAVEVITTVIGGEEKNVMAEEEEMNEHVVWVESSEIGEDGSPIKVPVPKGYSASQIEGETTVSGGFVIYEGDIDWNQVLAEETIETQTEVQAEIQDENAEQEEINDENSTEESKEGVIEETEEVEKEIINEENGEESTEQIGNYGNIQKNEVENINEITENNVIQEKEGEERDLVASNEKQVNEIEPSNVETDNEIQIKEAEESNIEENNVEKLNELEEKNTGKSETQVEPQAGEEVEAKIFELQKTVNQYVWVPIEYIDEIYGVDENGKLWGKLYSYSSSGRTPNNWEEIDGKIKIKSITGYREPDVTGDLTKYDIDSQLHRYSNEEARYEMLSEEMEENYYEMIKSIKKYGGFYIGRYETGLTSSDTAVIRKMQTRINGQTWYTSYKKCKGLKGENENVETSMIWGSLWDATLEWFVDVGAKTTGGVTITYREVGDYSSDWGNCDNTTFEYIKTNGEKVLKDTSTIIPTGSAEYTKVNNIYDMAGNAREWTLEVGSPGGRSRRGSNYSSIGTPADARIDYNPTINYGYNDFGSRAALYVK